MEEEQSHKSFRPITTLSLKANYAYGMKHAEKDAKHPPTYWFHVVNDATRWNKLKLIVMFPKMVLLVRKIRPDVIITTGAAPGYIAVIAGKLFGCKTCWIDSMANVERLSLSGERAGKWCDLWLTQWEHLEDGHGPVHAGSLVPDLISDQTDNRENQ